MIDSIGTLGSSAPPLPTNPGGMLGKDEFLQMLVAQLKNQDPLNPMNGDDMAAQLAHFSSVEQLTNIGQQLETQAAYYEGLIASIHDTTAITVLGKTVLAVGDQLTLSGSGEEQVHFEVGGQGGLAKLIIHDESGRELGSRALGFVGAGRQAFELAEAAEDLEPGVYRYSIEVVDTAGKPVPSQPLIRARVDSVRYGAHGPTFVAGAMLIPFGTIIQIATD